MIYRPQQSQRPRSNNTLLVILAGFLVIGGIGVSVWYLSKPTVINQQAAPSTTLVFNNTPQTVNVGQSVSADIIVNPGTNQVSLVRLNILYDGSKLQAPSGSGVFTLNQSAFPQTLEAPNTSCNGTQCTFTATYSVSNPTQVIQATTTLGTMHFQAIAKTNGSPTQVTFGTPTAVYSTATNDAASQNILSSTGPLAVTINDSACHPNQSTCSWDSVTSAVTYHYKVIETGSNTVIQESDITAPQTSVTFSSQPGKTYSCSVATVSACGTGTVGTGTSTCPALSQSPTPSVCTGPGTVSNLHIICPNCNNQAVNQ